MEFNYSGTCGQSEEKIQETTKKLAPYIKHLTKVAKEDDYNSPECSIKLPFAEENLKDVLNTLETLKLRNQNKPTIKYIVLVGIGGSNLGTKAVYDAIQGFYESKTTAISTFPQMIFLDTVDPETIDLLQEITRNTSLQEIVINCVTKSGKTTETIANLEFILKNNPELHNRLVVTTDEDSIFWTLCKQKSIPLLGIKERVGGRYSVFSNVGLFPLACAGIDVTKLLKGAMEARNHCLQDYTTNIAVTSAASAYLHLQDGKNIIDTFIFEQRLESLGKWYRQLVAESLGKDEKGATPTVSVGSNDMHSTFQLYIGGPKDKFFQLIKAHDKPKQEEKKQILNSLFFTELSQEISGKTPENIANAIYKATKQNLQENNIPFTEVVFELSEKTLLEEIGYFMQYKMIETMFFAKLLDVNAFDQPNVENYKSITKQLLNN